MGRTPAGKTTRNTKPEGINYYQWLQAQTTFFKRREDRVAILDLIGSAADNASDTVRTADSSNPDWEYIFLGSLGVLLCDGTKPAKIVRFFIVRGVPI